MKKYEIAVGNGIALKCKLVSEKEYNDLLKQNEKTLEQEKVKNELLTNAIEDLKKQLNNIKEEIKLLKGEE